MSSVTFGTLQNHAKMWNILAKMLEQLLKCLGNVSVGILDEIIMIFFRMFYFFSHAVSPFSTWTSLPVYRKQNNFDSCFVKNQVKHNTECLVITMI